MIQGTTAAPFPPVPRANEAWLRRHSEPIIDPNLPVIDAHHHLWNKPGSRYLADEFAADLATGHHILATVFIEATARPEDGDAPALSPVEEMRIAQEIADQSPPGGPLMCAAIVGHADLGRGAAVAEDLAALRAAAGSRFRGIRHSVARDDQVRSFAPAGYMADTAYREGFAELQHAGLSYDAWVYHPQLLELADCLKTCPEARVALNHLGGRIGTNSHGTLGRNDMIDWRSGLAAVAEFPNVCVKLGGLGMPMAGHGFHTHRDPPTSDALAEAWRPYIECAIEIFGPKRCMFESNFPVDKVSTSYAVLWNAFKKCAQGASTEEKADLFCGTASRFYVIPQLASQVRRTGAMLGVSPVWATRPAAGA